MTTTTLDGLTERERVFAFIALGWDEKQAKYLARQGAPIVPPKKKREQEEREAAHKRWLVDLKAGRLKKQQSSPPITAKAKRSDVEQRNLEALALVLDLEATQGRADVQLAVNFLAIKLDCSTSTASKLLKRLAKAGDLQQVAPCGHSEPARWSLTPQGRAKVCAKSKDLRAEKSIEADLGPSQGAPGPQASRSARENRPLPRKTPDDSSEVSADPRLNGSDASVPSTLHNLSSHALDGFRTKDGRRHGRTDALVWTKLTDDPRSDKTLGALIGKHRTVVCRSLKVLRDKELAAKVRGGWIRGPKRPEQVAYEQGTLGMTERMRKRRLDNSARNRR